MLKIAIPLVIFLSSLVYAGEKISDADKMVKAVLEEADQLFKQRSISNPRFLDMILDKLTAIENKADNSDLNYNVYVLESKILYWKAKYVLGLLDLNSYYDKPEDESIFNLGKAKAEAAVQIKEYYADAHYYAGLHLAAIAKILLDQKAPWKEFTLTEDTAKEHLKKSQQTPIYFEEEKEEWGEKFYGWRFDGYGAARELAYIQLRRFERLRAWSSIFVSYYEALYTSKQAYDNARNYAENVTTYAKILMQKGNYEEHLGVAILDVLLAKDPHTYNPDRIEETLIEFQNARDMLKHRDCIPPIKYQTTKEGLKDYAETTKLQEEASNRAISNQTKLNGLNAERLNWLEIQKRQEKIFSSFDLIRSQIEEATPILVAKIQAYLASQQDSLQTVLDDLYRLIKETQDPKLRDALQFEIIVLSDLAAVKRNLGNSPEALKKAMDQAIHGNKEERIKALGFFDPLTQAILKWVFKVSPPTKENVFSAVKQEIARLQIFYKEHLSTIESEIQFTTQNLQFAKDDQGIAQYITKKVYEACQAASLL